MAEIENQQHETSSSFCSSASNSHGTRETFIHVYSRKPSMHSHTKFELNTSPIKLDFSNTTQPQQSHTLDNDTTLPRRFRRLCDIYQELENLECHFSNIDNDYTFNLDKDNPHNNIEEPTNIEEALQTPNADHWINAMKNEMHSLTTNKTWDLVKKPTDRKIITCKWVL